MMHWMWKKSMKLHQNQQDFEELIELTAQWRHIPSNAVRKDYFITLLLKNLADSEFVDSVVFKGGTSLSKCYPGSIERFSEDIDLTYIPEAGLSIKQINKALKAAEKLIIGDGKSEVVIEERNDRNKSSYVWFTDEYRNLERIKLEIGSSVRPHPYERKTTKSYIQEFLESIGETDAIAEYELKEVTVNVLNVERTFIDKVMSVKRHAFSGTLTSKVRHIYDVVRLYQLPAIQQFLQNKEELMSIVRMTKETDVHYLEKRKISVQFDPTAAYDFQSWKERFSRDTRKSYELLHTSLLYSDTPQNWDEALAVFEQIGELLQEIGE